MQVKAVLDRFEGDYAVLLFGDEKIRVDLPRVLLPPEAGEGSWFKVSLELDPEAERKQRDKIEDLLNKLKEKNR
ncbi:MAG: DUF3006 domain-containing protein [Dethiobacteria bacterium]|jgi:hypothetical protein